MIHSAIPDSQLPISPIGFLFLKLPPPPCAVLLVNKTVTVGPPLRLPELSSTHISCPPLTWLDCQGWPRCLRFFILGSIPSARVKCACSHGTTLVLPDSAAILEKGLEAPFIPQDRPPLAIAMASDSAGGIGLSWPIGGNYDYPHEQLKGFPTRQQKT